MYRFSSQLTRRIRPVPVPDSGHPPPAHIQGLPLKVPTGANSAPTIRPASQQLVEGVAPVGVKIFAAVFADSFGSASGAGAASDE